jgi:hypothetical protein
VYGGIFLVESAYKEHPRVVRPEGLGIREAVIVMVGETSPLDGLPVGKEAVPQL